VKQVTAAKALMSAPRMKDRLFDFMGVALFVSGSRPNYETRARPEDIALWGNFSGFPMSALGQKQTFEPQKVMSALPPKADMCGATRDVRFGQKRTHAVQQMGSLFDHLICAPY
jgi:hypothetical protein